MDFYELIEKTRKVNSGFAIQYEKNELFLDLVEETGELAQAMLISSGRKITNDPNKQKTVEDVADALCDVMYNVLMIAEAYELDLPKEYNNMLQRLQKRMDEGEFDAKSQ